MVVVVGAVVWADGVKVGAVDRNACSFKLWLLLYAAGLELAGYGFAVVTGAD